MDKKKLLTLAKLIKLTKEIKTDEGVVLLIAGDVAVDEDVFVADENGDMVPAPDGTYTSENKEIVVAAGKITEVKTKEDTPATDPAPATEENEEKMAKFKAIALAFANTYEDKTNKIISAITSLGFVDGWLVSASDTEAVWQSYSYDAEYKYIRFEVAWNGDDVVVSNPTEVEPTFVPKGSAQTTDPATATNEEVETLKTTNESLKSEVETLKAKIKDLEEKTPAAPSIEDEDKKEKKFKKQDESKSFKERLLAYAYGKQN